MGQVIAGAPSPISDGGERRLSAVLTPDGNKLLTDNETEGLSYYYQIHLIVSRMYSTEISGSEEIPSTGLYRGLPFLPGNLLLVK